MSKVLRYILGDQCVLAFYEWDLHQMGAGEPDPDVVEWVPALPLPPTVRRQLSAGADALSWRRFIRRWRQQRIRLFSLMANDQPVAFGAIQDWRFHRRECRWLGPPGPILGPDWTAPAYRGRGFQGRLLRHRVHVCAGLGAGTVYVWASAPNVASRRSIERTGFRPRGCVLVNRACCRLHVRISPLPDQPARVRQ